jgi:serine/threonine-protein kinase ATR
MGTLPCAASGCIGLDAPQGKTNVCSICDSYNGQAPGITVTTWDQNIPDDYKGIIGAMSSLLRSAELRRSKKARVLAANAIRRMINHTSDREILLVGSGDFGPWLMRSLQSSVRELRIASA